MASVMNVPIVRKLGPRRTVQDGAGDGRVGWHYLVLEALDPLRGRAYYEREL